MEDYDSNVLISINKEMDNPYLNSFVRKPEFKNNRFNRYVKQFKLNMFAAIQTASSVLKFMDDDNEINDIEDYIQAAISIYYTMLYFDEETEDVLPDTYVEEDFIEELLVGLCLFDKPPFLSSPRLVLESTDGRQELMTQLINEAFETFCKNLIMFRVADDPDIDEFNFLKFAMPESNAEYIKYFNDIFQTVCLDLDSTIASCEDMEQNLILSKQNMENDLMQALTEISRLQNVIEEKDATIDTLLEKHEQLGNANKRNVKLATEDYRKENAELLKKVRMLEKELEEYKKKSNQEVKDIVQEEMKEETRDIDFESLKIVFVASENTAFENEIMNTFPNSKIIFDNFKIDFSKYDFVIVITTHITHANYGPIKDKCKNVGTKFLHCENTNIEKIKELIAENIE